MHVFIHVDPLAISTGGAGDGGAGGGGRGVALALIVVLALVTVGGGMPHRCSSQPGLDDVR